MFQLNDSRYSYTHRSPMTGLCRKRNSMTRNRTQYTNVKRGQLKSLQSTVRRSSLFILEGVTFHDLSPKLNLAHEGTKDYLNNCRRANEGPQLRRFQVEIDTQRDRRAFMTRKYRTKGTIRSPFISSLFIEGDILVCNWFREMKRDCTKRLV